MLEHLHRGVQALQGTSDRMQDSISVDCLDRKYSQIWRGLALAYGSTIICVRWTLHKTVMSSDCVKDVKDITRDGP